MGVQLIIAKNWVDLSKAGGVKEVASKVGKNYQLLPRQSSTLFYEFQAKDADITIATSMLPLEFVDYSANLHYTPNPIRILVTISDGSADRQI
ncbi:hypothetical protein ACFOET_10670 [Parapedobacter deserti]|uniref:Uncharacterized protein n=1 Tax=Parapedobacter deserti TaxID=1912957 RepID=A0ABV7JRZ5_9SPHI